MTRLSKITLVAAIALACLAGQATLATTATVSDIVGQVSQSVYTDYLNNLLYTHYGDNRSAKNGPQHELAAQNIFTAMRRDGLTTMFDPFTYTTGGTTYNVKNVIGVKQGMTRPDEIIVVGAHYDSTGYSGADDNASGVAGVLEAARVLSQYDFAATVMFVAFDNEENGLYGSQHMAADHAGDNITSMISADMISWNMPSKLNQAILYGNSTTIKQNLGSAITQYSNGIAWSDGGDWAASDQWSFENRGFQACWLYEAQKQGNTTIHGPGDSVDNPGYIDYVYATNMTRGLVGYLVSAAEIVPVTGGSSSVPEPGGVIVLLMGVCGLARVARRCIPRG